MSDTEKNYWHDFNDVTRVEQRAEKIALTGIMGLIGAAVIAFALNKPESLDTVVEAPQPATIISAPVHPAP